MWLGGEEESEAHHWNQPKGGWTAADVCDSIDYFSIYTPLSATS
jgi:hypothetical protein